MKMMSRLTRTSCLLTAAAALATTVVSSAQTVARRLSVLPPANSARVALDGSLSRRPATSAVIGRLTGTVQLHGMSLMLAPTAAQDLALTQLLADQQNPQSPRYRQWLTPAQFGARFGVADADIAVLQSWLQGNGFTVDEVAPSRNRIVFSGTAAAVESAFGTTLQRYQRGTQSFFENSTALQIPSAFAGIVSGISGVNSYRLQPPTAQHAARPITPQYTTASGNTFLVPWDVRQIYGSNTLVNSGFTGTGIKIGVLGQSSVSTTQLTYFQQKTGQTVNLPTQVLVPNTGTSGAVPGDEGESELDLEYAGGSAPGATILFIYTGLGDNTNGTDGNNNGVFDSLAYAVTNNLAPILTLSYGACEEENATFINGTMEPVLKQANAQGQTLLSASGDDGAAACETASAPTIATGGISVSYPASSTYATGVGGTTLNGTGTTYFSATNNSYSGSAIGYIPEIAWNDTVAASELSQSGGGASVLFAKPSWQVGSGVPADGHRDVPDVALAASQVTNAYAICSADVPCTDSSLGFAAGGGGAVGGTSAATPNFAAILAIIEQANGGAALGNINPNLYKLAGTSENLVFHDITSGNNIVPCMGGTMGCSSTVASQPGTMGFTAGVGYDEVTGLGSVQAPGLQAGLKSLAATSGLLTPAVLVSASVTSPAVNTAVTFSATVTGTGAAPTGTITFSVDGTTVGTAVALSSTGTASYAYSGFATSGVHAVVAYYSGDGGYTSGSSTINITATGGASSGSQNITLSAAPATLVIAAGGNGTETLTVTSYNNYSGPVSFAATLVSSPTESAFAGCYSLSASSVSPAADSTASTTMTIYTSSVACTTAGRRSLRLAGPVAKNHPASGGFGRTGWVVLSASLLGCFAFRRRLRVSGLLAIVGFALTLGLSGCGSSSSSGSSSTTSTGTYVIQVVGTSTTDATVSASSSFTVTVQ